MLQQRTRQEAFTEFVSDIEPRLHLALIGSLGTELAREATAEALAWAWENWERVQEMHNPGGYLCRVARSKIRPWFRRSPVLPPPDTQSMPWVEPGLPDAIAKLSEQQRVVGELGRLDPGENVLLFGVAVAERRLSTGFTITAVPLNDLGNPVAERAVSVNRRVGWDPVEPPPPPEPDEDDPITLGTALEDGWEAFTSIVAWLGRGVAYLLPFIGLLAIVTGGLLWRRRRYWGAPERVVIEAAPTPAPAADADEADRTS